MKYKWLNEKNNENIIVFFNGWGMNESIVNHLEYNNYDVLMFYDYNNLETDFDFSIIKKYTHKYLIAWSMGVMCASLFDIEYDKKIAINGTLKPIDNKFGIPERVYDLTIKGFNELSLSKFVKNMFQNTEANVPTRDFDNIKSELIALKEYKSNPNFVYDKILISKNDAIIPTKNQTAFWKKEANIDSGHAPFNLFNSWSDIL